MIRFQSGNCTARLRRNLLHICQAAALALIVTMALPARAADDRPIKFRVPPTYPELAKRMKIGGAVRLGVSVDADGKVTDVKELSGNHMLAEAATEALKKWKFAPAPSETNETIEINFATGQ